MSEIDARDRVAAQLRALGHSFIDADVDERLATQLDERLGEIRRLIDAAPRRQRTIARDDLANFAMGAPAEGERRPHELFRDSIVSGTSNPLGLGAELWREGAHAFMEVNLGKAFEGAPGRAHGGIVAALIDETMGLVLGIEAVLAFTVQLAISYVGPTPIGVPIRSEAWLEGRERRKLYIRCVVRHGDQEIANADGVFVTVDPSTFLAHLPVT